MLDSWQSKSSEQLSCDLTTSSSDCSFDSSSQTEFSEKTSKCGTTLDEIDCALVLLGCVVFLECRYSNKG